MIQGEATSQTLHSQNHRNHDETPQSLNKIFYSYVTSLLTSQWNR